MRSMAQFVARFFAVLLGLCALCGMTGPSQAAKIPLDGFAEKAEIAGTETH